MHSQTNPTSRLVIPILLGLLVYLNILTNGFTFDDTSVVVENYYIKRPVYLSALLDKTKYFEFFGESSYRPFVTLTYFADHWLWGFSPRGFHLTNLLLHLADTVLFFALLRRLYGDRDRTFLAVMLFSLHPAMTEAVNAVGFREELLAAFCAFASLLLYLKSRERTLLKGFPFRLLANVFLFAGLLAKENMLAFPAFAALVYFQKYDWRLEKPRGQDIAYAVLMASTVILYLFVRFYLFKNEHAVMQDTVAESFFTRVSTGISIAGYYLKLFLFPFPLTPEYTFPKGAGTELLRAMLTLLVFGAISFAVWISRNGALRLGWFWFLAGLVPTLNIYPIANPVAERYLYMPSAGIYIVAAVCLSRIAGGFQLPGLSGRFFAAKAFPVFALMCFAVLTVHRNSDWKNSDTLWEQAYRVTPGSFIVLNNVGLVRSGKQDFEGAVRFFTGSLEINPRNVRAYSNLGLAYREMGNDALAAETFLQGLRIDPGNPYILINLGKLKLDHDEAEAGLGFLRRAIESRPYFAEPYLAMGNYFLKTQRHGLALESYRRAAENRPDYPEPLINTGVIYAHQGRYDEAVKALGGALKIAPADTAANINLAAAYFFLNDYENAAKYAKIARELGADLPDILRPLAGR